MCQSSLQKRIQSNKECRTLLIEIFPCVRAMARLTDGYEAIYRPRHTYVHQYDIFPYNGLTLAPQND